MDLNKYTQKSQEAILNAQHLAQDYSHQALEPAHLLLALLRQEEGIVPAMVSKVAGSVLSLRNELTRDLEKRPKIHGSNADAGPAQLRKFSMLLNDLPKGCRTITSQPSTFCSV